MVRGYNSLQIGVVMFATGVFMFFSGPLAGFLEKKLDLRFMLGIGIFLFGMALVLNGDLTSEVGFSELFFPQVVRGISIMFCFLPLTQITLGVLPKEIIPYASGLYNLMRNLGGAIGIAVIDTILQSRIRFHTQTLKNMILPAREGLLELEKYTNYFAQYTTDLHLQELMAYKGIAGRVSKQAAVLAFNDVFIGVGLYLLTCLLFIPFLRHVPHAGASSGAGH
jgi:DHA2 family multidrug resistance protein